jgi:L-2-amino-thiazoline-4-carboxylic acid hydrolase/Saccharopine dehydrogenase NADP binding domain
MRDSIVTANISERPPARIDLRKFTTPILVSLLRREMRFPSLFLIWCKLTVGRLEKRIDPKFPQELVDLAVLPLWVYINLKGKIGQKRAFEIMRIAILTGGVAQWNFAYRSAVKERSFENLHDAEIEVNKTGTTRWNTLVVERSERRFEIKMTRCLYHELCVALGIPELTPVVCQIDNAAFNLPDERFRSPERRSRPPDLGWRQGVQFRLGGRRPGRMTCVSENHDERSQCRGAILIAGGYGVVGRRIAADLAKDHQDRVIIAGRDLSLAEATVKAMGLGVRGRQIDVCEPTSIADALKGVAAVVSCIDQPRRALLRAAVERGLIYTDITPHLTKSRPPCYFPRAT